MSVSPKAVTLPESQILNHKAYNITSYLYTLIPRPRTPASNYSPLTPKSPTPSPKR